MSNFLNKQSTRRKTRRARNAKEDQLPIWLLVYVHKNIAFVSSPRLCHDDSAGSTAHLSNKENVNNEEETTLINKILNIGISHYKIIFLPEENNLDPIKLILGVVYYDRNLLEYAYRDRIVNLLIEDIFLDVNNVINMRTGEIENTDRKVQRPPEQKCAIGWSHNTLLMIKVNSSDCSIGFGEVVGNACYHNNKKMTENQKKSFNSNATSLNYNKY
ncbi:hypothetical protein Glove_319g45 [Diversispora epigaea]|uniref:Uncharacterized protein n=1 Tax=Diversispora epigaea TaxID=1348612 RepID=A0A397HPY4_9GLOM|nr:hypothetical protein Glove_319g45 [Diversispora epigaea]